MLLQAGLILLSAVAGLAIPISSVDDAALITRASCPAPPQNLFTDSTFEPSGITAWQFTKQQGPESVSYATGPNPYKTANGGQISGNLYQIDFDFSDFVSQTVRLQQDVPLPLSGTYDFSASVTLFGYGNTNCTIGFYAGDKAVGSVNQIPLPTPRDLTQGSAFVPTFTKITHKANGDTNGGKAQIAGLQFTCTAFAPYEAYVAVGINQVSMVQRVNTPPGC